MMQGSTGLGVDPAQSLEAAIRAYVAGSPMNRLDGTDGSPIYDEPLVGFADGDDPLFQDYKKVIGDFHLTPRELLEQEPGAGVLPGNGVSVISVILPVAKAVRLSNRKMTGGPSLQWNQARWQGQPLAEALARHVASLLREAGFRAVVADEAPAYQVFDLPNGRCSNWSQRHAAYAAGLGTFSLNDALITPRGIAVWCTSLVTDLKLRPTPRTYPSHLANCPFFVDGSCGACIERCPAGAISAQGHDKIKCREEIYVGQKQWLEKPGYTGKYAGCGLCLTRVPCEAGIPKRASK